MGELGRGEENEGGIKLFGAVIRVKVDGEVKKEKGEIKIEDQKRIACPRCKSMETKFCYFNNYNVNQPRHFCKSCQRYWTAGGALRNVPIGAGRRKAKSPCHVVAGDDENINNGLVMDEWHGDFRQIFPAKRPRTISAAQHQGQ